MRHFNINVGQKPHTSFPIAHFSNIHDVLFMFLSDETYFIEVIKL